MSLRTSRGPLSTAVVVLGFWWCSRRASADPVAPHVATGSDVQSAETPATTAYERRLHEIGPSRPSYDPRESAKTFAQTAGVFGGFALTAIVLVVDQAST